MQISKDDILRILRVQRDKCPGFIGLDESPTKDSCYIYFFKNGIQSYGTPSYYPASKAVIQLEENQIAWRHRDWISKNEDDSTDVYTSYLQNLTSFSFFLSEWAKAKSKQWGGKPLRQQSI